MMGPLSRKQQREDTKFLFDEMRKTVALKKDQQRKDELHKQKLSNTAEKHKMSLDVPRKGSIPKPTNPEAGPSDKIPALLAPGEAVIPAKAAQKPENKPLIKAMVKEGRSDKNLSVPMPKGFMCGTTKVKGYQYGSEFVDPEGYNLSNEIMQMTEVPVPAAAPVVIQETPPANKSVVVIDKNDYSDDAILNRMLSREGSKLVENDSGSGASKYGITQKWNPNVDVRNLTEEQAREIYRNNYLSKVPEGLTAQQREAYFDTVVNQGPDVAKQLWEKSEGDLNKFADLRIANYQATTSAKDKKGQFAPLKAWIARANEFRPTAEKVLTSATGSTSANASELPAYAQSLATDSLKEPPKPSLKDQEAEKYYKRDPNRVQVFGPDENGQYTYESIAEQDDRITQNQSQQEKQFNKTPQGAYEQQDFFVDENGIPRKLETAQEKELYKQVNEVAPVPEVQGQKKEGWMSFISDGLVNGLKSLGQTISDPNKLSSAIKSFASDTLGLTGGDAGRFATLYLAQKALGISDYGAALYAGKYTLQASDERTKRADQHKYAMVQKGYKYDENTKQFLPGDWKTTGTEYKYEKVREGPLKGTVLAFKEQTQGGTNEKRMVTDQGLTMSMVNQINRGSDEELINQVRSLHTPSITSVGVGDTPESKAKVRMEYSDKISNQIKDGYSGRLGALQSKLQGNKNYSKVPTPQTAADQLVKTMKDIGLDATNPEHQEVFAELKNNAIENFLDDAERAANGKGDIAKINDISFYVKKAMLVTKGELSPERFKTKSGDIMPPSAIVFRFDKVKDSVKAELEKEKGKEEASKINLQDATIARYRQYEREFRELEKKGNNPFKPSSTESAFDLFIQHKLNQEKKSKK